VPDQLPSPEEIEQKVAERRHEQDRRSEARERERREGLDEANRNLSLVREFVERARREELPLETVAVRRRAGRFRRKRAYEVAGWNLGLHSRDGYDLWLLGAAADDPPFWWKITEHRDGRTSWSEAESVPLNQGRPLFNAPSSALQSAIADLLVDLTEKKRKQAR